MAPELLDAFDTVAHSEKLLERLEAAAAELSKKQGLKEEKAWLEVAITRVRTAKAEVGEQLLTRVLRLPELEPMREDHARTLQNAVVDEVEKLHAGITFAAGSRAPLLEALYGRLKIPVLRRCDREDFERFCVDFDKRLNTGYARRMFADPAYALVLPTLERFHRAVATWRGVFEATTVEVSEAQALRDELDAAARRLELPCRQARALAEAALAPLRDLLEQAALAQKPKKRVQRHVVLDDDASLLDEAPLDPALPSVEERAEFDAVEPSSEATPEAQDGEDKPKRPRKAPRAAEA
jgi:hypothetical protein